VKTHLTHIYRKLKVSGRTAAAAELMRQGRSENPPNG
jgi:DNA-binding CsgD family transcriptional regulator